MVPMPHRLPTDSISFVGIACGAQFSLALDTAGGVWSWGNGDGGGGMMLWGGVLGFRDDALGVLEGLGMVL